MTNRDIQFMKEMGIEPSSLDDPFPSLLPPPPPEAPTANLTEEDARWLQNVGVIWDETKPGFIPPGTPLECPTRYHRSIRQAV